MYVRLRGVACRFDGVTGAPGVQASLERLGLKAEPAKLQRRTGAGLLPRSGAVQHERLVAEAIGRPLDNLVGQDPDTAGDADAVAVVFGAASDIQDQGWVRPPKALRQASRGDPRDVVR